MSALAAVETRTESRLSCGISHTLGVRVAPSVLPLCRNARY